MNGQPTVTVCLVNYCEFSEEGWTLSYDSTECVEDEKCTAGQTVLVVILTVLYWMAVVVAAFVLMYFKIDIGYL